MKCDHLRQTGPCGELPCASPECPAGAPGSPHTLWVPVERQRRLIVGEAGDIVQHALFREQKYQRRLAVAVDGDAVAGFWFWDLVHEQ